MVLFLSFHAWAQKNATKIFFFFSHYAHARESCTTLSRNNLRAVGVKGCFYQYINVHKFHSKSYFCCLTGEAKGVE